MPGCGKEWRGCDARKKGRGRDIRREGRGGYVRREGRGRVEVGKGEDWI